MSRILRRFAALAALVTLFFATLSVSAFACPMATAPGSTAPAMAAGCPAHDQDIEQPNLCQAHCTADQQRTAEAVVDLPPVPLEHGLVATLFVPASISSPATCFVAGAALNRATSPPSTIRHCCFRL